MLLSGQILTELDFKILNIITWQKTNPPPNFSRRYFTHSTEQIIWARKHKHVPHYYNYELMKQLNGGKQMKDVWTLPAIAKWEKSCGKHPTQKPLSVLTRIILASTKPGAWILDPFTGSSTTGIAANLANRRFVGIDKEHSYLEISKCRKKEIENEATATLYRRKIHGFNHRRQLDDYVKTEHKPAAKIALGFCRKKDIPKLTGTDKFYFHAIESNNKVRDFPHEIFDAEYLYTYEGGRGKPLRLTGHFGKIKDIKQVHKSRIPGKENSKTEFYWEISLEKPFIFNPELNRPLKINELFKNENRNKELIRKYLPVVIEKDRFLKEILNTKTRTTKAE